MTINTRDKFGIDAAYSCRRVAAFNLYRIFYNLFGNGAHQPLRFVEIALVDVNQPFGFVQ